MIIVAGSLRVAPGERQAFLDGCLGAIEAARSADGCMTFTLGPDPLDDATVTVYERWQDEASLLAFRGAGPDDDQQVAVLGADVRRFEVSDVGPA
ncbi:putative quinol monooxygenase [Aeromicrobium sp. CF4.19]|uniref:putative quinol monooxygenase n=1 Tax=Aeromicrobium sp. CF4.19 TaxID=3373082 RepID=UPI003EE585DD